MWTPVAVVMTTTMVMWGGAMAQTGCTSALVGLAPCLNYISGSSTTPSTTCCSQLSNVVQSEPQCLCQVLNGQASSFGVTINQTQALALPGACKVNTPPVSQCNDVNQPSAGPVGSPTSSPADASTPEGSAIPDAPTTTPSTVSSIPSTGTGSKSSTGSTSSGNMTNFSVPLTLLLLLFITSTASLITRM